PSQVLLNVLQSLLLSGPGVPGECEALRLWDVRLRGAQRIMADHDPLDHPGQLDVLEDLEDLVQGGPGFDGGPGVELAQAGIGLHRLDHQEQQLFVPARESPGRVAFTQPVSHFALNRLLDVLADDSGPGCFRYHWIPPSMPFASTLAHRVSSGATA